MSGNNEGAKRVVIELVNQTGFDGYDAGSIADSWRYQPGTPAYCTDLTLSEATAARERAIKEEAPAARDIITRRLAEHMQIVLSGDYPEGFVDKGMDVNRAYFHLPARTKK